MAAMYKCSTCGRIFTHPANLASHQLEEKHRGYTEQGTESVKAPAKRGSADKKLGGLKKPRRRWL